MINMNALPGMLIQRALTALACSEKHIKNFGNKVAINKTHMFEAKREFGKAEAYLDILKVISDETYRSIVNSEVYTRTVNLILETEGQLSRHKGAKYGTFN